MTWYHFVGIYLAVCIGIFVGMAREDARRLHAGEKAMWSHDASDVFCSVGIVLLWPIIAPFALLGWVVTNVWAWLIRAFTPKTKPPTPEPVFAPGDNYRDGGRR